MRRLVLALGLLGCGKSGGKPLDAVTRADVVEIREADFEWHLERHGGKFTWRGQSIRHAKDDPDIRRVGAVSADIVDRLLGAWADGSIPAESKGPHVWVDVQVRGEAEHIELSLSGTEEPYDALVTSIGRPKPL